MSNRRFRKITVSAPGRIDLSGGATDWCGYHTVAMAIDLRATVTIERLDDPELISITLGDLKEEYKVPKYGTPLDLFKACIELSGVTGFSIEYKTDIPKGAALGGSAPLTVATIFGLKKLFKKPWSLYYVAELAQRAETLKLQTVNGYQDQYTAVFGGLLYLDFTNKECQKGQYSRPIEEEPYATVERLDEYYNNFFIVVAIPKLVRSSSDETNSAVSMRYLSGDAEVVSGIKRKAALTQEAKKALVDGNFSRLYKIIRENQKIMRRFGFVNQHNDRIEEAAYSLGAVAVKNTGAGLGAMMVFCKDADYRQIIFKGLKPHAEYIFKVEMDDGVRIEDER